MGDGMNVDDRIVRSTVGAARLAQVGHRCRGDVVAGVIDTDKEGVREEQANRLDLRHGE